MGNPVRADRHPRVRLGRRLGPEQSPSVEGLADRDRPSGVYRDSRRPVLAGGDRLSDFAFERLAAAQLSPVRMVVAFPHSSMPRTSFRKDTGMRHGVLLLICAALSSAPLAQTPSASLEQRSAQNQPASGTTYSSKRMADGKQWTTQNLNVNTDQSYCYEDADLNCRPYGRLYTWESARRGCQSLGDGWRLPTDDEWRQMAKHYGGTGDDSADSGKAAYMALLVGGTSGFNAVLGGNRSADGQYSRSEAHGFYWTTSDNGPANAPFYNFGKAGQALSRQGQGEKQMAMSVRCTRE